MTPARDTGPGLCPLLPPAPKFPVPQTPAGCCPSNLSPGGEWPGASAPWTQARFCVDSRQAQWATATTLAWEWGGAHRLACGGPSHPSQARVAARDLATPGSAPGQQRGHPHWPTGTLKLKELLPARGCLLPEPGVEAPQGVGWGDQGSQEDLRLEAGPAPPPAGHGWDGTSLTPQVLPLSAGGPSLMAGREAAR